MENSEQQDPLARVPEAVVESRRRRLSAVWLLPIVALLAGGWLVVKTLSERGPEVVVSFDTAEGLEAGKTHVKLKDVTVGSVESVGFSGDLAQVLVTLRMISGTEDYLTDKTRFWVVRPRIGAAGVTGLGTLVSGVYIAMDPDNTGEQQRRFDGLEKPPVITADRKGTSYRLRADRLGSLSVGTPLYFRQIAVGEITEFRLSDDHDYVDVGIFVEAPHDQQVTRATRFWNASGVSVDLTAAGAQIQLESLVSLLSGGVAFDTPASQSQAPAAEEGHVFRLYPSQTASREQPITDTTTFALRFDSTVRGLEVGAPVEFRGIRVGTVRAIELGPHRQKERILIPVVLVDLEPQRLEMYETVAGSARAEEELGEMVQDPVRRAQRQVEEYGLRARLNTGNLVTGKLFVDLEYYPEAPPATLSLTGVYPEIPTLPGSLEGIVEGVQSLVNTLEDADLDRKLARLDELIEHTATMMAVLAKDAPQLSSAMQDTLVQASDTFNAATTTLQTLDSAASTNGELGGRLQEALQEISGAARSIRLMADYLERHPEALLRGKEGQ